MACACARLVCTRRATNDSGACGGAFLVRFRILLIPPSAKHLGLLKARLAKAHRELLEPKGGGGGGGEGFDVKRTGDARVGLVGFPSVGKSTLLTRITGTASLAAAYEFTVSAAPAGAGGASLTSLHRR